MRFGDIPQIEREKRRFVVLRHLADTPGYELNTELLSMGCQAQGVPTTEDQIRTAVSWLEEQDLVRTDTVGSVLLVTLTKAGREVADGRRIVPGVMRPGPID